MQPIPINNPLHWEQGKLSCFRFCLDVDIEAQNSELVLGTLNFNCLDDLRIGIGKLLPSRIRHATAVLPAIPSSPPPHWLKLPSSPASLSLSSLPYLPLSALPHHPPFPSLFSSLSAQQIPISPLMVIQQGRRCSHALHGQWSAWPPLAPRAADPGV